MKQLGVLY